jgi:hypothetical protein
MLKHLLSLGGLLSTVVLIFLSLTNPAVKVYWPIMVCALLMAMLCSNYLEMAIRDEQNRFYKKMWEDEFKHSTYLFDQLRKLQREDGAEWKEPT